MYIFSQPNIILVEDISTSLYFIVEPSGDK